MSFASPQSTKSGQSLINVSIDMQLSNIPLRARVRARSLTHQMGRTDVKESGEGLCKLCLDCNVEIEQNKIQIVLAHVWRLRKIRFKGSLANEATAVTSVHTRGRSLNISRASMGGHPPITPYLLIKFRYGFGFARFCVSFIWCYSLSSR
jgi:hypothetical protein